MISVISAGLFTTVQDEGRWGYQAFGMPVSGAMDRYACRTANILAGNPRAAAVLEMTFTGDTLRFEQDCFIAVCGADMQGTLNGHRIINWSSVAVPAGSVLSFGFAAEGCRTYVAVRGGIDVPAVLGSRSTYSRAAVGGYEGRKLRAGDVINIAGQAIMPGQECVLPEKYQKRYTNEVTLRVLPGPQDDMFTDEGLATLFSGRYTISQDADRMGYRLEGTQIKHRGKADVVSDALPQGAIQVPGHGMPIIMMADRQTTGGYTKIGTVIGPDLLLLAQAKPGDSVIFRQCSDEGAVAALRVEQECYSEIEVWRKNVAAVRKAGSRSFQIRINGTNYAVEISEG